MRVSDGFKATVGAVLAWALMRLLSIAGFALLIMLCCIIFD